MASDAVRVLQRQIEPYRQIPLDDDYWARLGDGRYQIVEPAIAQG